MIILTTIGVLAAAGTTLGIIGTCLGGSAKKEVKRVNDRVSDHETRIRDCEFAIVESTNIASKGKAKFNSVADICASLNSASSTDAN